MTWDDDIIEDEGYGAEEDEEERDPKIDECKPMLFQFFRENVDSVFYERQLQVLFEKPFFHWITADTLHELIQERAVDSELIPLNENVRIRCYWSPSNRYWKRKASRVKELVSQYSDPAFLSALGIHGESMFDVALPRGGFMPIATANVNSYQGKQWRETTHTLDRIYERDDVPYGVEIKNTLDYIPRQELDVKLRMCSFLGLRPLFIMRMAPKNYIDRIRRAGGFSLIFKYQLYPHGYRELADRIKQELSLPVDCPRAIQEGTIQRFLTWHKKQLPTEGQ